MGPEVAFGSALRLLEFGPDSPPFLLELGKSLAHR